MISSIQQTDRLRHLHSYILFEHLVFVLSRTQKQKTLTGFGQLLFLIESHRKWNWRKRRWKYDLYDLTCESIINSEVIVVFVRCYCTSDGRQTKIKSSDQRVWATSKKSVERKSAEQQLEINVGIDCVCYIDRISPQMSPVLVVHDWRQLQTQIKEINNSELHRQ